MTYELQFLLLSTYKETKKPNVVFVICRNMMESIVEIFPEYGNMTHVHMGSLERNIVGSNGVPTNVLRLSVDRLCEISKMPGREQAVEGVRKCCKILGRHEHTYPDLNLKALPRYTQTQS
jgi:hypothetical protein